jgi:hypothetical protein
MQYIETTEQAFDVLFNENGKMLESNSIEVLDRELYRLYEYHNRDLGVVGKVIHNFLGNTWSYGIQDINA